MKLPSKNAAKTIFAFGMIAFVLALSAIKSQTGYASAVVERPALSGEEIYARSCARCHGNDGRGQTPKGKQTGAKDFTKSLPSDAVAIKSVTNGKGKMPPFKDTLSADQIKEVVAYIRRFKQ